MIYVFNSAYRPLYTGNMLATLFLPVGWVNEYRYRLGQNIDERIENQLKPGTDVAVVFVDRWGEGGYMYHPVRLGELQAIERDSDQVFVKVQMGNFVYPKDISAFQSSFRNTLGAENIPHLTNGNPENEQDGNYVAIAESLFPETADCLRYDEALVASTNALSSMKAFKSSGGRQYVFANIRLYKHGSPKDLVTPDMKGDSAFYKLKRNQQYDLKITYRYPIQKTDQSQTAHLMVELDETAKAISAQEISIDSLSNSTVFTFATKKHPQENEGCINFSYRADPTGQTQGDKKIFGPDRTLAFRIVETNKFWVMSILAILTYMLCNLIIGINMPEDVKFTLGNLWEYAHLKILLTIVQTGALLLLFSIFGRKIL